MKNMFGKPKKKEINRPNYQKHIELLEKQVQQLEKQVQQSTLLYETTLQQLKITESQKTEESLKEENSLVSKENETTFHEEEPEVFNEPEYIILPKTKPSRQKAVDLLEKEAVNNVNTNRREIIKKKIIEELKKKELSAKELKILFVDEFEYCSKATFYRYLESLREESRIDSIKINGKEYLCSIPSKINNTTF